MNLSFKGGIHPLSSIHHGKYLTDASALETMPAPKVLSFPISQHIGAPAKPIVEVGDRVLMGQKIAEASAFVSVPVHSSVSGTVIEIVQKPHILGRPVLSIVVENDFKDEKVPGFGETRDISKLDKKELVGLIQENGIVGMGGATFPTHVKLSPPDDKPIDYLIVNAAECEPFLTADHRALLEKTEDIINGLQIVMKILGVDHGIIGIENNKKDAIAKMKDAVKGLPITVKTLRVKYPQGGEKQLIQAITKREVPSGGLPMDIGAVVLNTSTCIAIYQALVKQIPLIERIVTVTGIVNHPSNLIVRVGTSFGDVCEYVGGFTEKVEKLITGGGTNSWYGASAGYRRTDDGDCAVFAGCVGHQRDIGHFGTGKRTRDFPGAGQLYPVHPVCIGLPGRVAAADHEPVYPSCRLRDGRKI